MVYHHFVGLNLFVVQNRKKLNDNDYETSLDEQDENNLIEDDPIREPPPPPQASHRKIIAMTLASRKLIDKKIIIYMINYLCI